LDPRIRKGFFRVFNCGWHAVLISPFRVRWDSFRSLKVAKGFQYDRKKHLLQVAMDWKMQISHNSAVSPPARIA
jgi:hypothetical protein